MSLQLCHSKLSKNAVVFCLGWLMDALTPAHKMRSELIDQAKWSVWYKDIIGNMLTEYLVKVLAYALLLT